MKEMYAVLSYDAEDGGLLGCNLFNTKEDACNNLRRIVTTECWVCLREKENIKKIDNVVAERDMVLDSFEDDDIYLCEELGVEVGKEWTWARLFDSAYSVSEAVFVVQKVEMPKGE